MVSDRPTLKQANLRMSITKGRKKMDTRTPLNKRSSLLALVLALLLVGSVLLCACSAPAAQPGGSQPGQMPDYPAELFAEEFYAWYQSYPGNALADKTYKTIPYFSADYIKKLDEQVSKGLIADPIICAQDMPDAFEAGPAVMSESQAVVRVTSSWDTRTDVTLIPNGDSWLIQNISCVQR
jgi:hypothetical protein